MSNKAMTFGIIGGTAVVLAAALGAFLVLRPHPAPAPAPAAAPVAKTITPPAPALSATDANSTQFAASIVAYTVQTPTPAYIAASTDAPQMYPLGAGLAVRSTEKSNDGKWVIVMTEDGQAAFIQTSALGPYDASKLNEVPQDAPPVAGAAHVVDTATLLIDNQQIKLFGISGETGVLADQLQDLIDHNGSVVNCEANANAANPPAYVCSLQNGTDVARAALYNGAASPNNDATQDYLAVNAHAKQACIGLYQGCPQQ